MQKPIALFLALSLVLPLTALAETDAERRARIEAQLQDVERQMLQQQVLVEDKRHERQSLERDIDIINAEIRKTQLGIEARSLAIASLSQQIGDKEVLIEVLNDRLDKQKQSLAKVIRQTQATGDYSLAEVMLSSQSFSEFFVDVESFRSVKESLSDSLQVLYEIRSDTELQKEDLEHKQLSEAEMKRIQELERERIKAQEAAKQEILTVTRGEEQAYQAVLQEQQRTAAQLRAQLFELLGGGGGIPLPEAIALARTAGGRTGVPASLILAVLKQETDIGSHLGSCIYSEMRGDRAVMHPDRDAPVFLALAEALGFDANRQQVSCPITQNGSRVGWGGAMGPSQFIPSTWAIYGGIVNNGSGFVYDRSQDVIRTILGKSSPSSPFNNQDAFTATALLLRDNGANGTHAADRLAALRYYAGWGGANNPANQFYGDSVMIHKAQFEADIQVLDAG